MALLKWTFLALAGLGLAATATIPRPLADYRRWTPLTPEPQRMPYQLATMCAPFMKGLANTEGPHKDRWVVVYANPVAIAGFKATEAEEFPEGSIIAKEKRLERDDAHPDGVAFMIKHGKGELQESGGWEFAFYPSAPQARYDGCVDCHRSGGSKDYVFSTLTPDPR